MVQVGLEIRRMFPEMLMRWNWLDSWLLKWKSELVVETKLEGPDRVPNS